MAVMDLPGFTPFRRDAILQPRDIKTTLSSWDNCMAKSYCKWPVIVAIIVAALILCAILWCLIACLCCGYTCCKGCCSCCSCCCPSGRKSHDRSKYADEHSAYNTQNRHLSAGYQPPPPPPVYEPQRKFAQFDSHPRTKANDDALPQMPMWDTAPTRRVEDTSHDLEMNHLDPVTGRAPRGGYYDSSTNPNSPAYPPSFDGYRGTETTNHHLGSGISRTASPGIGIARTASPGIGMARTGSPAYGIARTPSPGNPLGPMGVGMATTRNPSPGPSPLTPSPNSSYPPYTDVPTTTTHIGPGPPPGMAVTSHRTTSPPPQLHPIEPPRQYARTPMPHSPSPPSARSYSPYPRAQQQQQPPQQQYVAYSPSVPETPPPPFSSTLGDYDQVLPGAQHGQYGPAGGQQGPPSMLQPGRRPGDGWN